MLEAIDLAARGALIETPQDEALATYTSQVEKKDAVIDWNSSAAQIERMIRAYDPWPVARTRLGADEVLIWRAAVEDESQGGGPPCPPSAPGTIVSIKPNPVVQCGTGRLRLLELQAPGRKRMSAADFLRGKRVEAGARFDA
jgi:methionyl-tRNA formyltransferase